MLMVGFKGVIVLFSHMTAYFKERCHIRLSVQQSTVSVVVFNASRRVTRGGVMFCECRAANGHLLSDSFC